MTCVIEMIIQLKRLIYLFLTTLIPMAANRTSLPTVFGGRHQQNLQPPRAIQASEVSVGHVAALSLLSAAQLLEFLHIAQNPFTRITCRIRAARTPDHVITLAMVVVVIVDAHAVATPSPVIEKTADTDNQSASRHNQTAPQRVNQYVSHDVHNESSCVGTKIVKIRHTAPLILRKMPHAQNVRS